MIWFQITELTTQKGICSLEFTARIWKQNVYQVTDNWELKCILCIHTANAVLLSQVPLLTHTVMVGLGASH